jgi:hypothetical protein
MPSRSGGFVARIQEAVERRTGQTVVDGERLAALEEAAKEGRALSRELDLLGWTVMDYLSGQPQEVRFEERKKMAQQARMVWAQDPQAGAAVDLSNSFVFGRGVQKPKARDEAVQEVIDEAWDDPDNQLVLTTMEAQVALNTDLELQSNVFLVMFDDGEDGKVKLGLLDHDTVEDVVRDPENRLRILWYLTKTMRRAWDFANDRPALPDVLGSGRSARKTEYYAHWRNVELAEEDEGREEEVPVPPDEKLGVGKVRHVAVNRTSEQAFGVPTMRRTIRWFTAYNDFMKARVDMAQAAAAFIMKRKVQGTPTQLAKLGARAVSRSAPAVDGPQTGPRPASMIDENEAVSHENINLNSGAGNAETDGQMIRSQISAATHFPQHYLGDAGSANLATATSMELPVLKHIEGRQEVWEGVFRWFIDRVIEKAVEDGKLDKYADEEEPEEEEVDGEVVEPFDYSQTTLGSPDGAPQLPAAPVPMRQAHEDQHEDEERTERDLSYEFSMPNPLKRATTDLVTAVSNIAKTFDPNNSNPELSRILLGVVLGEGLEMEDPQGAVERIFPEDYVDPMIAQQQQMMAQQMGQQPPGFPGADGQQHGQGNPYGAPMRATPPGAGPMQQASMEDLPNDALWDLQWKLGYDHPIAQEARRISEARFRDLPEGVQVRQRGRMTDLDRLFREEVLAISDEALVGLAGNTNGNGNGNH